MPSRISPLLCLALGLAALAPLRAADLDGSPPAVGAAEAQRLYREANDYVANVPEGPYSYAYIQFYWKRAQSFIDRAERVYPDSPTARALKAGQLKVGPYDLEYFRDRVLPRLEEKRTYTVDSISCANFLYERDKNRHDAAHQAAFADILEALARQDRWGEALNFPSAGQRPLLLHVVFQTAARFAEQPDGPVPARQAVLKQLLADTPANLQADAGFPAILGEAYALAGRPRADLAKFLAQNPRPEVKLAVLRGMAEREVQIRRRAALRLPAADQIQTRHYTLLHLGVRDDVEAVARQFFPEGAPAAQEVLDTYHAALGARPSDGAAPAARVAYLEYLGIFEKFDEVASYAREGGRPGELKAIEMFARGGRLAEADRRRAAYGAAGTAEGDDALLAEFRGQLDAPDAPLTVREKTFSSLPIRDPDVLAEAIMEWALTPVSSIRGASPWDSVVLKYEPGFTDLPAPESKTVRDAASIQKPY